MDDHLHLGTLEHRVHSRKNPTKLCLTFFEAFSIILSEKIINAPLRETISVKCMVKVSFWPFYVGAQ